MKPLGHPVFQSQFQLGILDEINGHPMSSPKSCFARPRVAWEALLATLIHKFLKAQHIHIHSPHEYLARRFGVGKAPWSSGLPIGHPGTSWDILGHPGTFGPFFDQWGSAGHH